MSNLKYTHIISIWPDSLVMPHNQFNLPYFCAVSKICQNLTVLACPSFIQIQNYFANQPFEFSSHASKIYEYSSELDRNAQNEFGELLAKNNVNLILLTDLIDENEFNKFSSLILAQKDEDLNTLMHLNSQVGAAAGIDLSLTLKAQFKDIGNKKVAEFVKLTLLHNIIAVEAMKRLLESIQLKHGQPTLVCQNSVYSQNISIANYLIAIGIDHMFCEPTAQNLSRFKIYKNSISDILDRRLLMSSSFDFESPSMYYSFAKEYLQKRIAGNVSHSYSPNAEKFISLRIEDVFPHASNKLRYVYFGNSPDELQSISINAKLLGMSDQLPLNNQPFSTEYENLKELFIQANSMPNASFFIRMHPRLGADKRGLGKSFSRKEYTDVIFKLKPPANVTIIYPEDVIPSYWLGCWCDVVLSFRGTMPLEMNLLCYNPLIGSADCGIVNSSIHDHATSSRRSKAQWSYQLSKVNEKMSIKQLRRFVRDFYYSRDLGCLTLENSDNFLDSLRISIEKGSSLNSLKFSPQSTFDNDKKSLILYLLWLQDFISSNICSNQDAPVFMLITKYLRECLEPTETI